MIATRNVAQGNRPMTGSEHFFSGIFNVLYLLVLILGFYKQASRYSKQPIGMDRKCG